MGKQGVNRRPEVSEKTRESRYGHVIDAMSALREIATATVADEVGGLQAAEQDFVIVTDSLGQGVLNPWLGHQPASSSDRPSVRPSVHPR